MLIGGGAHLYGGQGNDQLQGYYGDDILYGNDILAGGKGSDTYVFQSGFGQDTIYDTLDNGDQTKVGGR